MNGACEEGLFLLLPLIVVRVSKYVYHVAFSPVCPLIVVIYDSEGGNLVKYSRCRSVISDIRPPAIPTALAGTAFHIAPAPKAFILHPTCEDCDDQTECKYGGAERLRHGQQLLF